MTKKSSFYEQNAIAYLRWNYQRSNVPPQNEEYGASCEVIF